MAGYEVEEGEAFCHKDNDEVIDPDIALSYIDEKLQNVLGHFQRDFEGGVSAENLGAKFGGYGSFLPTYKRSPAVRTYPTTPQISHNNITAVSPNNFHSEGEPQISMVPSNVPIPLKHVSASLNMHSTSADGFVETGTCLLNPQEEKVPAKDEPLLMKSVAPTEKRKLKVRFKVRSDNAAQKNAAIYSGLGLISPSSSMGHSPDESGAQALETQESPHESPSSILQCMTSFPVAGAVPLSPLHHNLLHLIRKDDAFLDSKFSIPIRNRQQDSADLDGSASISASIKVSKNKKTKSIHKVKTMDETKHRDGMDFEGNMTSPLEENLGIKTMEKKQCFSSALKLKKLSTKQSEMGESSKCAGRTLEAPRETQKDVPLKKRDVDKAWVKNRKFDLTKEEPVESLQKDVFKDEQRAFKSSLVGNIEDQGVGSYENVIYVDPMKVGKIKGNCFPVTFEPEINVSKTKKGSSSVPVNTHKKKVGLRGTMNEQDRIELHRGKKKSSLESKITSTARQISSKLCSNVAEESLRCGTRALESTRTSQKDVAKQHASCDDILDIRSGCMDNQTNLLERLDPFGERVKDCNFHSVKEKEAVIDGPLTQGLSSEVGSASVAPSVPVDNWVQCDSCGTWRLLPYGIMPDQLPDKWLCSMLDWLPGKNRCDFSQAETEDDVRALYQSAVPFTEALNNLQSQAGQIGGGSTSTGVQIFSQNYKSLSSDAIQNLGNVKHKAKEIRHAVNSNSDLIQAASLTKNLRQDDNKSRNDKSQVLLKRSMINTSTAQRPFNSSSFATEMHINKQEKQVDEGATKGIKLKSKRESDHYEYASSKRIKTEAALHLEKFQNPENEGNLGKVGLRSSSDSITRKSRTNMQRATELHYQENEMRDRKDMLPTSSMRQRDKCHTFLHCGSLNIKTGDDTEIYVKNRKLKDWQDNPNKLEILQSHGNRHPDGKVSSEEKNVNREYRVSKTEGQESITSRGDYGSQRKGKLTRIILSGSRYKSSDISNDPQQNNMQKVVSKLTLDDVDISKKEMGSEQFSPSSTSSSSKVSNSRKRSFVQEVKGSSVDSVSSSPSRTPSLNKVSSTRRGNSGKDYCEIGNSPVAGGPRTSLEQKSCMEVNRIGTSWKGESSDVFRADPVGWLGLEFRDRNGSVKAQSNVEPFSHNKNNQLSDDSLIKQHQCLSKGHTSDQCKSEERMNKKVHMSGNRSPLLSQGKEKSIDDNVQKATVKFSNPLSEQGFCRKNIQSDEKLIDCYKLAEQHEGILAEKEVCSGCNIMNNDDKNVCVKDSENWENNRLVEIQMKIGVHSMSNASPGKICSVDRKVTSQQNSDEEIVKRNPSQVLTRFGKAEVNLHHTGKQVTHACDHEQLYGSLKGSGFALRPVDGSGDSSKVFQRPGNSALRNGTHQSWGNPVTHLSVNGDACAPNPVKGKFPTQAASGVLKEAEQLRGCADHLKKSGFKLESNMTYFQAALKFLLGASLLEASKNESSKYGEMSQIQIYSNTAKLCETCAHDFEEQKEISAAALAYKCMEMAYMRVLYCKSFSTNKDRHDLQACLQIVPQGESPSSSASDVDNLNNQVDKAAFTRSMASNAGNHLIVARKRPEVVWLLDLANDVSSAMEASRKALRAFTTANAILKKSQNNDRVISVKRVIDFGFQDVEEFLRLVRLAFEAISLQCFQ